MTTAADRPFAAPSRVDARCLAPVVTALGGASVPLLALDPLPPWWPPIWAAAAALYAVVLLRVGRWWGPVLGAMALFAVILRRELESVVMRGVVWALGLVLGLLLAVFFAAPAIVARRAHDALAADALDRVLVRLSLWLGALAVSAMALSETWLWFDERDKVPRLVGDGRLPWIAALSALALGALFAGATLFRDARRARLAHPLGAARRLLLRRAGLAVALFGAEAAGAVALAAASFHHLGPLTGIAAVAPRQNSTCALRQSGGVVCWGWNEFGDLGDGTCRHSYAPVAVRRVEDAVALQPPCALFRTGEVRCWSSIFEGPREARLLEGLPPARLLATYDSRVCVVTRDDDVVCWAEPGPPLWITKAPSAVTLRVDHRGGCVELLDRVQCWRHHWVAPLRRGKRELHAPCFRPPGAKPPLPDQLASVHSWIYEGTREGRVYGWRVPEKVGDPCAGPVILEGMEGVVRIDDELALGADGSVRTWKADEKAGSCTLGETWIDGGVIDVRRYKDNSCAVRADGTVWCWGNDNDWGQLGDGTRRPRELPTLVRR